VTQVRILHVSDLHFGRPVDSALIEAIEEHIAHDAYDVVAVSGDLSQRARAGEFQRASVFLRDAGKVSSGRTLTWNMRDISIIGDLRRNQVDRAEAEFKASPPEDARVIVMHHNPVKGELSQRHGLKHTRRILGAFATIGVDVVCCGHDHQEAIHFVEHTKRGTVISTAGTVSNRSRGGRPSSVNVLTIRNTEIEVSTLVWSSADRAFSDGPTKSFQRHGD
jgi:3',5'-cyclic AMP phosphodiesterase CpdA